MRRYLVYEYRVVWRWREAHGPHVAYPQRERRYKTEAGARRLIAKLMSNGGRYDRWYDADGRDSKIELQLDYARLEHRKVPPWEVAPL